MARAASQTLEVEDVLRTSYTSFGAKRCAAMVGRTPGQVRALAHKLGLKLHRKNATHVKLDDAQRVEAVKLYVSGMSAPKVAVRFGVKHDCIYAVLGAAGVKRGRTGQRNRKTTEAQEVQITADYNEGASTPDIAEQFGISICAVSAALHRQGTSLRKPGYRHAAVDKRMFDARDGRKLLMRSTWEVKTAKWLDSTDEQWAYEEVTYPIVMPNGMTVRYTPDFWIYDADKNLRLVIDVKGLRNEEQARRIEVFKLQYPALPFEVWNLYVLRKKGIFDSNKGGQMARAASTDL